MTAPDGPWLGFGLVAAAGAARFTGFTYRAVDRGFGFGLGYDGKLEIDGEWRSPALVLAPADDPYDAIDRIAKTSNAAASPRRPRRRECAGSRLRQPGGANRCSAVGERNAPSPAPTACR